MYGFCKAPAFLAWADVAAQYWWLPPTIQLPLLWLQGKLLSALDATTVKSKHLAPRVIDAQLLAAVRQVDFIGFVSNPHYGASKPAGEATRQAAPMRNKRAKPRAPISDRHAS